MPYIQSFVKNKMNPFKQISKLFLCLFAFYSAELLATPLYSSCAPEQTAKLIQELKLLTSKTLKSDELQERSDCIYLDANSLLIATANLIPNKENIYQIQLYLLNPNHKKILFKYIHPQMISEENGRFSSIKFDRVPYSSFPKENVVGLNTHHLNNGYFSYDLDKFNLFRVQSNPNSQKYNIQWVLRDIQTNIQTNWRPAYGCENGTNDDIKSIFILQNSQSHQLQDILLKQIKKSEDTDEKCKMMHSKKAEQQLLKFNGEYYQLNKKQLLTSEDIRDE